MNPYEAPRSAIVAPFTDDDPSALVLTGTARIAAGCGLGGGLLTAAFGLQGVAIFEGIAARYMLVSLAVGVTLFVGALRLRRMRFSGAVLVAASAAAILVVNVTWGVVFSSVAFVLMPQQLVQEGLAIVAAVLSLVSFGSTRRADAVRAKLRESGLGLGF